MSQEADNIILNSIPPKDLPIRTSLTGTEYQILYVEDSGKLEKIIVSSSDVRYVTILGNVFRLIKGYTGIVLNTGFTLEVNDFITDGVVLVSGSVIRISNAMYIGGDITNFGTEAGDYNDGNYTLVEYLDINN